MGSLLRRARPPAALILGITGMCLYNWWIVAAWPLRLLKDRNELFSDLEASGQPYAAALNRVDVAAGILLMAALLLGGRAAGAANRVEWPLLVTFSIAAVLGGLFPYVCAEGADASCRAAEWRFRLGWQQYAHIAVGIVEFGAATTGIVLAHRRTREQNSPTGTAFRWLLATLVAGYPLLAVAYLTDRLGAFVEPVFFGCFSAAVLIELLETRGARSGASLGLVAKDPGSCTGLGVG